MTLINTRLQNIRANAMLDKYEYRPSRYGALDLFMTQSADPSGILSDELKEKAISSIGNTIQVPVIDYDSGITIGNSRSVTIADSENTSQLVTFTFVTYAWGFTIVPSMYMNNEIKIQKDFETKFIKYLYKFAETLDTAGAAALSTAKTQVFNELLQYTNVGNAAICPWKLRENVLGDIDPMMAANDFFAPYIHLVGNGGLESIINKLAQNGVYNAVDKRNEYLNKILHYTTRITNAEGEYANLYAVQPGSVGMLTRFEREALLGTLSRTGHEWGIDSLPLINMPVGTYYYESVGDFSAINGAASADMDRVMKEHYGFAVDVAFVTAYNSDNTTLPSPIMKVTINSETTSDYPQVVVANETSNPVYTQEVTAS